MTTEFKINKNTSSFLDLIRWFSAFLVAANHIRTHFFVDYNLLSQPNIFVKFFYFFTLFGRAPVICFFVLSGYLVGGTILKNGVSAEALIKYAVDRLTRLYVVLIPVILLCLSSFLIYGAKIQSLNYYTLNTFLGNVFFLETIKVPCYGNNFPLWSLVNEFWYYVIFPLIYILFQRKLFKTILSLILLSALLVLLPWKITSYFPHWALGVAIYYFKTPRFLPTWLLLALFGITCFISRVYYSGGDWFFDLILAISLALVISKLHFTNKNYSFLINTSHISKTLSSFSFSLYLLHVPIFYIISIIINFNINHKYQPTSNYITLYFLFCLVIFLAAFLFSFFTERKTSNIRKFINNIF